MSFVDWQGMKDAIASKEFVDKQLEVLNDLIWNFKTFHDQTLVTHKAETKGFKL